MSADERSEGPGSERQRQEDALRRLLAEAVEPVRPGPGAEARLQARVRAQAQSGGRGRADRRRWFGWGATALGSVAVILVAVVLVVNGTGGRESSGASSAGSAASSPQQAAPDSASGAGPSAAAASASGAPPLDAPGIQPRESAQPSLQYSSGAGERVLEFSATPTPSLRLAGVAGAPSVTLPAVGAGAGIRAVVTLPTLAGGPVDVAVVRLTTGPPAQDVLVSLAGDRPTLLTLDGQPLRLTVDAAHGYACTTLNGVSLANGDGPYVVDGSTLTLSPFLVKTIVRPGTAACPS
jgi:hypothetical protein